MIFMKISQLNRHVKAIDGIFNLIRELEHDLEDLEMPGPDGGVTDHNSANGHLVSDERCIRCRFDKLIEESGIEQRNEAETPR